MKLSEMVKLYLWHITHPGSNPRARNHILILAIKEKVYSSIIGFQPYLLNPKSEYPFQPLGSSVRLLPQKTTLPKPQSLLHLLFFAFNSLAKMVINIY